MELLKEVLAKVRRLDDLPPDDEQDITDGLPPDDEFSLDDETDLPPEDDLGADGDEDLSLDGEDAFPPDEGAPFTARSGASSPVGGDDEFSLDDEGDLGVGDEEHPELDGIADQATADPDRQGLIRTVKGAHLVYKRDTEDGTFEELWVYNITDMRKELDVKKAILAGTDIPTNKMHSPDGSQTYEIWAAGNAEVILIKGLPN